MSGMFIFVRYHSLLEQISRGIRDKTILLPRARPTTSTAVKCSLRISILNFLNTTLAQERARRGAFNCGSASTQKVRSVPRALGFFFAGVSSSGIVVGPSPGTGNSMNPRGWVRGGGQE